MSLVRKYITLSQGHKLVERLTRYISEQEAALSKLAQPVTISFIAEKDKVARQADLVETKIEELDVLYTSLRRLRSAIGSANDKAGIHSLLARQAVLKRQQTGLATLVVNLTSRSSAIAQANVEEAFNRLERKDDLPKVSVEVLGEEHIKALNEKIQKLERQIMGAADTIHGLNGRTEFEIELPQAVAEQIGLIV